MRAMWGCCVVGARLRAMRTKQSPKRAPIGT